MCKGERGFPLEVYMGLRGRGGDAPAQWRTPLRRGVPAHCAAAHAAAPARRCSAPRLISQRVNPEAQGYGRIYCMVTVEALETLLLHGNRIGSGCLSSANRWLVSRGRCWPRFAANTDGLLALYIGLHAPCIGSALYMYRAKP